MPLQLPELNFWIYLLASMGAAVIAFMLTFSLYFLGSWLKGLWLKRKAPKDMKDKSLANPGKPAQLTEKEVEEHERQQFSRFREFEKLRRLEEQSRESERAASASGRFSKPALDIPTERREIPEQTKPSSLSEYERDIRSAVNRTAETSKSTRFTRPEFL